jgi:hypothetical protein
VSDDRGGRSGGKGTDEAAAAFLDRLVCCGSVTPVVESGGLLLTAPTPAEALLAVRRVMPSRSAERPWAASTAVADAP